MKWTYEYKHVIYNVLNIFGKLLITKLSFFLNGLSLYYPWLSNPWTIKNKSENSWNMECLIFQVFQRDNALFTTNILISVWLIKIMYHKTRNTTLADEIGYINIYMYNPLQSKVPLLIFRYIIMHYFRGWTVVNHPILMFETSKNIVKN